jgi:hypothetical protein
MRIEVGQTVPGIDLAQLLERNEGTFLAQQGGQTYLVTAQAGHSISGIRPVGQRFNQPTTSVGGQEPWVVTKISNDVLREEREGYSREREREQVR